MKPNRACVYYLVILFVVSAAIVNCSPRKPNTDDDSCQTTGECWDRLQCIQGRCQTPPTTPPTCTQPPCDGTQTEPASGEEPDAATSPDVPTTPQPDTVEPDKPAPDTTKADTAPQDTGGPCVPITCEGNKLDCGVIPDGCGKILNCGLCGTGQQCGIATPNVCGCRPDCSGRTCGVDPICGTSCGSCAAGKQCQATTGTCVTDPGTPPGRRDNVPEPTFAQTKNVSSTIVITKSGVYDYKGVLHIWSGKGSCNQTENQPYILRIAASNVTIKNFAYKNAPDGIHIGTANDGQGHSSGSSITNITLDNVTGWGCEDALTTQYGVKDVVIKNSQFFGNPNPQYRDKLLQLNFGNVTIEDSVFKDTSTCVMFKGGQNIRVLRSRFINCDRAINGSTIHGIKGKISTQPSTLYTEKNEAYFAARANQFWDQWYFATGDGMITMTSVQDTLFDTGKNYAKHGATITVK